MANNGHEIEYAEFRKGKIRLRPIRETPLPITARSGNSIRIGDFELNNWAGNPPASPPTDWDSITIDHHNINNWQGKYKVFTEK